MQQLEKLIQQDRQRQAQGKPPVIVNPQNWRRVLARCGGVGLVVLSTAAQAVPDFDYHDTRRWHHGTADSLPEWPGFWEWAGGYSGEWHHKGHPTPTFPTVQQACAQAQKNWRLKDFNANRPYGGGYGTHYSWNIGWTPAVAAAEAAGAGGPTCYSATGMAYGHWSWTVTKDLRKHMPGNCSTTVGYDQAVWRKIEVDDHITVISVSVDTGTWADNSIPGAEPGWMLNGPPDGGYESERLIPCVPDDENPGQNACWVGFSISTFGAEPPGSEADPEQWFPPMNNEPWTLRYKAVNNATGLPLGHGCLTFHDAI